MMRSLNRHDRRSLEGSRKYGAFLRALKKFVTNLTAITKVNKCRKDGEQKRMNGQE